MDSDTIKLAEKLSEYGKKEPDINYNNINKSIKLYNNFCMNNKLSNKIRIQALDSYIKHIPDQGIEMVYKWRDILLYIKDKEYDDQVKLLVDLCLTSKNLPSHEKIVTAVTLYNNSLIIDCYTCFKFLAFDTSLLVNHRLEAIRYLFASDDEELLEMAKKNLILITNSTHLQVEFRYKCIANYISKTGINTEMNKNKLYVPYNELFVHSIQSAFFNNEENEVRFRLLSGQHLLQMYCVSDEERNHIQSSIMSIADREEDSNVKADALDVLIRVGDEEYKTLARELIIELGRNKDKTNLLNRHENLYNDSQNVHDHNVNSSIQSFVCRLVKEFNGKENIKSFTDVYTDISIIVKENEDLSVEKKENIFNSLNRISVDTADFTKEKVTISELLVYVWMKIQTYDKNIQTCLEQRMIDELLDMSGTCSSGHFERVVNVLSSVEEILTISWESQITSNVAGRLEARMKNEPEDIRASLVLGMMENADEEDRDIYLKFIRESLKELHIELKKEFVDEGYIDNEYFERIFKLIEVKWIFE